MNSQKIPDKITKFKADNQEKNNLKNKIIELETTLNKVNKKIIKLELIKLKQELKIIKHKIQLTKFLLISIILLTIIVFFPNINILSNIIKIFKITSTLIISILAFNSITEIIKIKKLTSQINKHELKKTKIEYQNIISELTKQKYKLHIFTYNDNKLNLPFSYQNTSMNKNILLNNSKKQTKIKIMFPKAK